MDEVQDKLNEEVEIIDQILNDDSLKEMVREQLVMAGLGQGKFGSRVEIVRAACRAPGISDGNFLIASHIRPWSVSSNDERSDGKIGLMLSPHINQLFDVGYISFNNDGSLIDSTVLQPKVLSAWSIDVSVNACRLNKHQSGYMAYHRKNAFWGKL